MDNEKTVLHIPSEDAATHEKAACLGAELQAGHKLYNHLQALYIPSDASISQRPPCTVAHHVQHTSDRRDADYERIETDEDSRPYSNIDHNSLTRPAGEGESQRYRNVGRREQSQAVVKEVVYERATHEGSTERKSGKDTEEYYNVVTSAMIEDDDHIPPPPSLRGLHSSSAADESTRRDPSPPPLGPKPNPHTPEQEPTLPLHELVDGDYYETGVSIFTSNNDQTVV